LRYNPSPDTLLKEIKKVHPGHYLLFEFENGISVSSRPYTNWRPPVDISESGKKNPFDTYTQKIENAVARQLLSDVDIGVLLSGGVDSAVVAALASKHYGKRLKAFTIGFEEVHFEDEIHDAAYTASFLGIDHYYRRISFTEFLTHIRTCTEIVEEPLATTSIIPMYYLAELASEHVKVVLTGQGADEPLGGYRKYKLEMLRTVIPPPLRKVVSGLATMAGGRNEAFRRGSSALSIKTTLERFLATSEVFVNAEIQALINISDIRSIQHLEYIHSCIRFKTNITLVEQLMALDTRMNLADDLLNYTDKLTMHFSLECRVPLLDLELVRYIEGLPVRRKLNMTAGKIIHKQFAQSLLPREIVYRKKKGFQSPTRDWFRRESQTIREILLVPSSAFARLFNQAAVSKIIDEHQDGYNREKQIFLLLSIHYWLEYVERKVQHTPVVC
jgi:asparagine synthase (glutamine-hydrolysing)